ncbi:hypothetical protein CYA_1434 [Synechococcus sp. JA-3-3Ab]|nr:hypothetical protein CYA_1434 [Synechococcus sp. JA-3-3Ab]
MGLALEGQSVSIQEHASNPKTLNFAEFTEL